MAQQNQISKAVISRLPRYYRYLRVLIEKGVERVSSEELSRLMKATASQIRQDLNNFGGFGQQGYGYNVKILGVEQAHDLIVIGAGNLGRALVRYKGFSSHGFKFRAMFDIDENLCGKSINGVKVHQLNGLVNFVMKNKVDIAALTIPSEDAIEVSKQLYSLGIRYFWNFAHTDLIVPDDVIVENVHLSESLMQLSYRLNEAHMVKKAEKQTQAIEE